MGSRKQVTHVFVHAFMHAFRYVLMSVGSSSMPVNSSNSTWSLRVKRFLSRILRTGTRRRPLQSNRDTAFHFHQPQNSSRRSSRFTVFLAVATGVSLVSTIGFGFVSVQKSMATQPSSTATPVLRPRRIRQHTLCLLDSIYQHEHYVVIGSSQRGASFSNSQINLFRWGNAQKARGWHRIWIIIS
jgi:hypothetical protein